MKLKAAVENHDWECNLMSHRLRRWGKNGSSRPRVILVSPLLEEAGLDRVVLQVY